MRRVSRLIFVVFLYFIVRVCQASVAMAQTIPLPVPVLDHIAQAQILDGHMTGKEDLANIYFVWGSKYLTLSDRVMGSFYYPNQRDLNRLHTIAWFKENHPDWVVYQCDKTTPAYGYTYAWGAYAPLDTNNPQEREYLINTYFLPAISRGYRAIALDNVAIVNFDKRCGVWRDGQWIQQFSGESRDHNFTEAKLNYIRWIRDEMHKKSVAIALNAKIDPAQPSETEQLISFADIWVDESGFSDGCRRKIIDALWYFKQKIISENGDAKAYVSINHVCGNSISDLGESDSTFLLASFLVTRTARSYLSVFAPGESGKFTDTPALHPDLGKPLGAAQTDGSIVWRPYERGLAAVNPSSKSAAPFELPSGRWRLNGQSVSAHEFSIPPRSGLILGRFD